MTIRLTPSLSYRFIDSNGKPVSRGSVKFVFAGTNTLAPIYQDKTGTPAPNPVNLDAGGCYDGIQGVYIEEAIIMDVYIYDDLNGHGNLVKVIYGLDLSISTGGSGNISGSGSIGSIAMFVGATAISNAPIYVDDDFIVVEREIKYDIITPNRVLVSDANKKIVNSAVTDTELSYLSGVTSNIQSQLNGKESAISAGSASQYFRGDKTWQTLNTTAVAEGANLYFTDSRARAAITGAASTIVADNLTADRVLISNPSGKVSVSSITSTELNYLSGLASSIQTQLNDKVNRAGDTMTGSLTVPSIIIGTGNAPTGTELLKLATHTPFVLEGLGSSNANQDVALRSLSADRMFYFTSQDRSPVLSIYNGNVSGLGAQTVARAYSTTASVIVPFMVGEFRADNPSAGNGVALDFGLSNNMQSPMSRGRIAVINQYYKSRSDMVFYTSANNNLGEVARFTWDGIIKGSKIEASTSIKNSAYNGSKALISDASKNIAESSVTSTELSYLSGVTSNIQSQLDNRVRHVATLKKSSFEPDTDWQDITLTTTYGDNIIYSSMLKPGRVIEVEMYGLYGFKNTADADNVFMQLSFAGQRLFDFSRLSNFAFDIHYHHKVIITINSSGTNGDMLCHSYVSDFWIDGGEFNRCKVFTRSIDTTYNYSFVFSAKANGSGAYINIYSMTIKYY